MPDLTLAQASTIVDAALAKGHEMKLKPLTVAVLDAGGHPRALKVEDGSSLLRHQIATGKAWGALGMGMASRKLVDRAKNAPAFLRSEMSFGRKYVVKCFEQKKGFREIGGAGDVSPGA